jgi:hypothetical protein
MTLFLAPAVQQLGCHAKENEKSSADWQTNQIDATHAQIERSMMTLMTFWLIKLWGLCSGYHAPSTIRTWLRIVCSESGYHASSSLQQRPRLKFRKTEFSVSLEYSSVICAPPHVRVRRCKSADRSHFITRSIGIRRSRLVALNRI